MVISVIIQSTNDMVNATLLVGFAVLWTSTATGRDRLLWVGEGVKCSLKLFCKCGFRTFILLARRDNRQRFRERYLQTFSPLYRKLSCKILCVNKLMLYQLVNTQNFVVCHINYLSLRGTKKQLMLNSILPNIHRKSHENW